MRSRLRSGCRSRTACARQCVGRRGGAASPSLTHATGSFFLLGAWRPGALGRGTVGSALGHAGAPDQQAMGTSTISISSQPPRWA